LISIVSFDITIYMRMVTPSIKTAELAERNVNTQP